MSVLLLRLNPFTTRFGICIEHYLLYWLPTTNCWSITINGGKLKALMISALPLVRLEGYISTARWLFRVTRLIGKLLIFGFGEHFVIFFSFVNILMYTYVFIYCTYVHISALNVCDVINYYKEKNYLKNKKISMSFTSANDENFLVTEMFYSI